MRLFNQKGFTLVEILIVLSVISMLFFVLVPQINGFFLKSKESGLRTDFKTFQVASESFFRETLGNHMETEGLNKFLDSAHHVTDNGTLLQTKSVDPWHHPYEVEFGVRKISFSSFGEKENPSLKKYSTVTYLYNGVIDSCTYGFATGNISLSKIKGVPTDFVCGNELSTTAPAESGVSVSAPSNFKTLYVEETMASLVWDKVPGATSYVLKRNGVTIYTGSGNTYSDITLARGVTYTYALAAKTASNTSVYVDLSVTTLLVPPAMTGKGTVADPYLIFSVYQLQSINKKRSAHYALGTNIDASSTKNWNGGKGFLPIDSFYGSLDGREHAISNLFINNSASNTGLFSYLDINVSIRNIFMMNADISGTKNVGIVAGDSTLAVMSNVHVSGKVSATGDNAGGVVGSSSTNMTNVSSKADVKGNAYVGGIAGSNSSNMDNVTFEGTIQGTSTIGGLAGSNSGVITNANAKVTIRGNDTIGGAIGFNNANLSHIVTEVDIVGTGNSIGGLVGSQIQNKARSLKNIQVKGFVSGANAVGGIIGTNGGTIWVGANIEYAISEVNVLAKDRVGGVVGWNESGALSHTYAKGNVFGSNNVGGLVGYEWSSNPGTKYMNVYATGDVSGKAYIGGLVGFNYQANIQNAYSTGKLTTTGSNVGGLIGNLTNGSLTNAYYDKTTTGMNDTGKGLGKTTAELQTQATYTGWDFTSIWKMNPSKNNGYPTLRTSP